MSDNISLFLTAVEKQVTSNIVSPKESKSNKDFVVWGDGNKFPNYLMECYNNCPTLQSIINGTSDYVCGDDVIVNNIMFSKKVNNNGETMKELISKIALDYLIFGCYALHILRNYKGEVSELYWVDVTKLRSDEKNEVFYYSEDWNKSYGRVKTLQYPKYSESDENTSSIFFYKNNQARTTYGTPIWSASLKNVAIEMGITNFHLNELENNFMGSKLISFCNGIPDEKQKAEIENAINEKFSGNENAGRILISFAQHKDNAPIVSSLATDDFDKRYETLEKRNKEQIFVAFRATPVLFGLVTESNGFATNEYRDSYKIYAKTVVNPIQQNIVSTINKIIGENGIEIKPFTINFDEDNNNEKQIID